MNNDELDLLFADLDVGLVDLTDHIEQRHKDASDPVAARNTLTAAAEMISDARSLIDATQRLLRPDAFSDEDDS